MAKKVFLSVLLSTAMCSVAAPLARTAVPAEQRITQTIIVNGRQAEGVTVVQNGVVQTYTCASPQQYTAGQSSSGWACYDATTGNWLLNAQPPQTAQLYDQPPPYYPAPPPVYNYYGYPYPFAYTDPFGYYPYGYYGGPAFLFGFGYGHGYYGHGYYGRGYYGHGYYAPFAHGPRGGSFGHGSFGHGGHGHR